MSIVLDNPELETAVAKLAAEQGVDGKALTAKVIHDYVFTASLAVDAEGRKVSRRVDAQRLLEIGRRCAGSARDSLFLQRSLYDENGLPT